MSDAAALGESWRINARITRSLGAVLDASAAAVSALLDRAESSGGRVKGFKPHARAFLA